MPFPSLKQTATGSVESSSYPLSYSVMDGGAEYGK